MLSVCFRYDDPSALSDHDLERRILHVFAKYETPLCVAPSPFRQSVDGEVVALSAQHACHLIDAQRSDAIDIALHGHTHIHRGDDGATIKSEFTGLPLAQQSRLIEQGLAHLSALFPEAIEGFVPPWNQYDRVTARAVAQAGMVYLSASWEMIGYGDLAIVPRTCTLKSARTSIEMALKVTEFDPVVVVVFHGDSFREFRDPPLAGEQPPAYSLSALDSLLGWIKGDTPVNVSTIREVAASVGKKRKLWRPHDLPLPYRLKSIVHQNMLLRSPKMSTMLNLIGRKITS